MRGCIDFGILWCSSAEVCTSFLVHGRESMAGDLDDFEVDVGLTGPCEKPHEPGGEVCSPLNFIRLHTFPVALSPISDWVSIMVANSSKARHLFSVSVSE